MIACFMQGYLEEIYSRSMTMRVHRALIGPKMTNLGTPETRLHCTSTARASSPRYATVDTLATKPASPRCVGEHSGFSPMWNGSPPLWRESRRGTLAGGMRYLRMTELPVLHDQHTAPTSPFMKGRRSPVIRIALLVTGALLILVTPLVGIIPGPGGIFTFAAGLVLVLQNSNWARGRFVRLKRRWPRFGHYADMALRRRSFRQRQKRDKEAAAAKAEAAMLGFPQESR